MSIEDYEPVIRAQIFMGGRNLTELFLVFQQAASSYLLDTSTVLWLI